MQPRSRLISYDTRCSCNQRILPTKLLDFSSNPDYCDPENEDGRLLMEMNGETVTVLMGKREEHGYRIDNEKWISLERKRIPLDARVSACCACAVGFWCCPHRQAKTFARQREERIFTGIVESCEILIFVKKIIHDNHLWQKASRQKLRMTAERICGEIIPEVKVYHNLVKR
ncbi:hypothetical protein CAPTEDRAFT_188373 [Capitella teleta]|uniref:Uncharacterized protein n=1 Tax=Capitella teleta TaxID=283909 RepID=R7VLS5_CAPTE|nr:hypothetical protein CAPTEDRAFT_188373 [Capitella teleta]|eukprot:ELU18531.1 hypothetical protein CAPTEDRAFT_188373 [Capitella teleta]